MRKYIIAIVLMAIGGVFLSLYLIPGDREMQAMRNRDATRPDMAGVDYAASYAEGDRSSATLVGATDARIREGRGHEMKQELITHLEANPQDVAVRKSLAELYRLEGNDEAFVQQLEKVAEQEPSEGNLKLLADTYNYVQRYREQGDTLRRLVDVTNGSNPEYYADLAIILALQERRGEAAGVVQELKSRHPNYTSFKLTQLVVGAAVDSGDMETAFKESNSWTSQNPNPEEIAYLADRLNYGGRPDLALQLMNPVRATITQNEVLYLSYVNALINDNQSDAAYEMLIASHDAGALQPKLYTPFISLALERGEITLAERVVKELKRENFTADQAAGLLEMAHANEEAGNVTRELIVLFDEQTYMQDKPALAAIVALIRRDVDEDAKVQTALASQLSRSSRIYLARACARNSKEECFQTLVKTFPAYEQMSPREVNEIVDLYISVQREDEIADSIKALAEKDDSEAIKLAVIKIAAAQNNRDAVVSWLNREGATASTTTLTQLFFLANDRGHGASSAEIAAVLYQREPSEVHRDYVISSYLRAGLESRALPLIRQARGDSRAMEDNYLAALTKLGKGDATYREELRDYVLPQLQSDEVESERKLQLVYTLINTGNKQLAVPYIDQYAKSEGGDWKTLYNQVHAVASSGRGGSGGKVVVPVTERSRDFRVALARDPQTSEATKRMLAFSLLDDGYKQDATDIFFDLAQTKGPNSQELQDLLYLWGPRLNQEQMQWLSLRAANAQTRGDRVRWGELIANQGDDYALMNYVTNSPEALEHPALRQRYFLAMGRYATEDTYKVGLREWVDTTQDSAALVDYANAAIASGYPDAALYALKRVEKMDPANEGAVKTLAILSHGRADYSESQRYIKQYEQIQQAQPAPETSPYEVLFYQAELLRRERKMPEAQHYYNQLIQMGEREATDLSRQTMYYSAMFYAGHADQGREGFYGLLQAYPDNKGVLADFLSVLLENGHVAEARQVANQYDKNSPFYQSLQQPVTIDAPSISGVETGEGGQEMRINFNAPVQDEWVPNAETQPEWVEGVVRGYDSIVIAAKPGYELRFRPTSSESVAVVASNGAVMSPEERLERQQDLRLQLLYARMELESGNEQQALERVNYVKQYFPNDPQLLGFTANVENAAGNWPRALATLQQAQSMAPENEDFALLRDSIERVYAEEIKADHEWRRIGDSDEQITTLSARLRPSANTELGISVQNDEVSASQIRHANTGVIDDFDVSRQRGEVYGAYYLENGDRAKAAVFANTDTVGGGAYYAFNNPLGRTELLAEYQKPYWDFPEAVIEEANRTRIGAQHYGRIDDRTTMSGEVSANQYNIALEDDVAQTVLVRANVVRRIHDEGPEVLVGYGFDGEYLTDSNKRRLANGDVYRPLPLVSREIHYPSVIVAENLTETTRGEVVAGWAFDRLGEHGPQVQGTLTQDVTEDIEAQLRASYGLQTNDTDQNATRVGGHLRYKF